MQVYTSEVTFLSLTVNPHFQTAHVHVGLYTNTNVDSGTRCDTHATLVFILYTNDYGKKRI